MRSHQPIIFIVTVLVAALFGCASYTAKPLEPARTAAAFEARTLDSQELKEFLEANLHREPKPWPLVSWDFRYLTLAAFYYHPDLDVARAAWGVAEAGKITAGQRPNPSFGFTPQFDANAANGVSPWTLTFNLDIPIETAGKRGYRMTKAQTISEAARLNIALAAWGVRSRLAARFFDLYTARHNLALLQRQEAVQREIVTLLEARLASGEVSLPDVTQAHVAALQTRLLLWETQRQEAEAFAGLASALGVTQAAIEGMDVSFVSVEEVPPVPSTPDTRRQALIGRPDILAALTDYEAAEAALHLEIAKQYPDLHLGPGYKWDQDENKWFFGFSVMLPILNRNQGPVAEAEARRKEAAARFTALQARVIGAIEQAVAGYCAALDKLKAADRLLFVQQSRQASSEALFKAGEADRLILTSTTLEAQTAALARLEAFSRVLQARRLLEDALQRPLDEPSPAVEVETNPRPEKEKTR
jgi:outer membrane protein, heavy metal efflux system